MNVETTRFGTVEIDLERVIVFSSGLLGFADFRQYALLQPDDDGIFFWLQSLEAAELAFVVTDPRLWIPDYQATIRREQMDQLELSSLDDAQVFAIVNKYDQTLTANMQGPLVINVPKREGMQLVLADKRWTTRHELIRVGEHAEAVPA